MKRLSNAATVAFFCGLVAFILVAGIADIHVGIIVSIAIAVVVGFLMLLLPTVWAEMLAGMKDAHSSDKRGKGPPLGQ